MKKTMLSLLAVLALALCLCACSSRPSAELKAALCGTWYEREYQEAGANPGYFQLNSDGTGLLNGQEAVTWSARKNREYDSRWTVTVKTKSRGRYTLELYAGNRAYPEVRLTMKDEETVCAYLKAETEVQNSWFADLLTTWYVRDENAPVRTVELNEDGAVKLDDQNCFWTVAADWEYHESSAHLDLYDEQGICGALEIYSRNNGLYDFRYNDYSANCSYGYYEHPLLVMMENGTWESFDKVNMIDDYFYMTPRYETVSLGDREYAVQFDAKADLNTLRIEFLENGNLCYVANVFTDGGYPMATLTDQKTGQETLYFNNHYGYAEDNPDAAYYQVVNLIYRYVRGDGVYTLESGAYLDEEERLPYIYQKLQELGDYKQAREFLDRFTVVPSMLTEVTLYCTDWLDNTSTSSRNRYGYDENGEMVWAYGQGVVELFGVDESSHTQYFTYDQKGKIAKVQVGSGSSVQAVGTPVYDTVGKLVGMTVQERHDEYTTVFTFDVQGRVIRMGVSEEESAYPLIYDYTYDDAGRLNSKIKTSGYHGNVILTSYYTYDGDALREVKEYHQQWGNEYSTTYTYTNDEKGRPLSAEITTTDPNNSYKSQEIKYVYEDLYFFDDTGLLPDEN